MNTVIDTSVIIDVLRGNRDAARAMKDAIAQGTLCASEITRLEVLAEMRDTEEQQTRSLLDLFAWYPLDDRVAELAGELGRRWLPGNRGIDAADLAVAATAILLRTVPLTRNTKHFPMFRNLSHPY